MTCRAVVSGVFLLVTIDAIVHLEPSHPPGRRFALSDVSVARLALDLRRLNVATVRVEDVRWLTKQRFPVEGSSRLQELDQSQLRRALPLGLFVAERASVSVGEPGKRFFLVEGVALGAGHVVVDGVDSMVERDRLIDSTPAGADDEDFHAIAFSNPVFVCSASTSIGYTPVKQALQ